MIFYGSRAIIVRALLLEDKREMIPRRSPKITKQVAAERCMYSILR